MFTLQYLPIADSTLLRHPSSARTRAADGILAETAKRICGGTTKISTVLASIAPGHAGTSVFGTMLLI